MNSVHSHDHDWAVRQLMAYSIGMLPEEQTLRLEEHLGDCSDCRARLAPLKQLSPADAGHLPASLIATWPRKTRMLSGLERGLVQSHLSSCEACRATLAFAGHEPVLSPEAAAVPARPVLEPVRRREWGWALGLSGLAAAAAGWLLIVQPALFPRDSGTSATMGSLAHGATEAVVFELAVPPGGAIALPEQASALPGRARVLEVGPVSAEAGLLVLVPANLRPGDPGDGSRKVVLTLQQGRRQWAYRSCRLYDLGDALRVRPTTALPAGDYELRVAVAAAGMAEPAQVWTWPLRVR